MELNETSPDTEMEEESPETDAQRRYREALAQMCLMYQEIHDSNTDSYDILTCPVLSCFLKMFTS